MKIRAVFLLLTLLYAAAVRAIHFKHIGPEEGLAHPTVLSICQDSIGRIWFGTTEGLSVYDGNQVHSYKPHQYINSLPLFPGEAVKKIISTSGSDLYFMTNMGFVKYNIRKDVFTTIWEKNRIHSIYNHQGLIWIVVSHELYQWDDKTRQLTLHTRLPFEISNEFLIDREGRKWFASPEGIFRTDDDIHFKKITAIPNATSIFESGKGDIWAGSNGQGLFRITPDGKLMRYTAENSSHKGLRSNKIREIAEDEKGNLWFGTFDGLYKFDPQKETFTSYTREDRTGGITHSSIYPVFIDEEGTLWAGTYFGGVNYTSVKESSFTFYNSSDRQNYLSNPVVGSMAEDKNGNIWICTEGGGLNMLQPQNGNIRHFTSSKPPFYLPHTNLKSILYDPEKDMLYIGTNSKGLYSYDIQRNRFKQEIKEYSDSISTIDKMAREGDKLFLSSQRKIYVYSLKEQEITLLYQSPDIASAHVQIDSNKNLWVVEGTSVHVFDTRTLQKIRTYDLSEQGIFSRIIRTFQSSKGNCYICTYGNGIMKLDTLSNKFEPFPAQSQPLLNSYCYQLAETPSGKLIATGDKGITVLTEEGNILKSLPLEGHFPLNAFMRDCGLFVSKNGTIYVGSINGMVSFSEEELLRPDTYTPPYFANLYVHGNLIRPNDPSGILNEGLPFTGKITLTHKQNKIDILFASQTDASGLNPQLYEYKLEGMDKTWYQTAHKSISYTNLMPGNYILELRKKSFSSLPAESRKLHIAILPPWYASWWAWTIWTMLFLTVSATAAHILLTRKRLNDSIMKERTEKQKIKEINEAKFRFFTNVSHEFKTPLTLIVGQLELLLQEYQIVPSTFNKLTKVIHQAQHLSNLITELIEFRKYEQEQMTLKAAPHSINRYMNQIYDSFKELALQQNIKYAFEPCKEDVEVWFDGKQMLKVFYNLLGNAFKYTPKNGEISVSLSADKQQGLANIRIIDSGVGINPDELEHVFDRFYQADNKTPNAQYPTGTGIGLALAKTIVEAHKGTIGVKSQTGYGTIFTVTLRLGDKHLRADKNILFEENGTQPFHIDMPHHYLPAGGHKAEKEEKNIPDEEKPTAILIEDNAELLDILVNLFTPFFNVHTAGNGKEGYELVRQIKPDIVVSDVMMPEMTGTELCSKVKNDIELCHIPVVLLTALNLPEQTIEGLVRGADDYISKPFNAQVLLARCNNLIRSRKMLHQLFTKQPDAAVSVVATNKLDQEFMKKVMTIIDNNLIDPEFNNDKLASEMYMGRSSFYNKFKALTGMSPNDFISSYKLKKASVLLKSNPELSISEIADRLGYNTLSYFCRKFKEQFKVSPSKFREEGKADRQES